MCNMEQVGPGTFIPGPHEVPASINVIVGTPTGSVSDIQTWRDGNTLDILEAAATPGQNVEITFTNIKAFRRVAIGMYYSGSVAHWIEVQLWDNIAASWKTLRTILTGLGLDYKYSDLPVRSDDFVNGSGEVKMRLYHPAMGNAAHNSFIDYAALIR